MDNPAADLQRLLKKSQTCASAGETVRHVGGNKGVSDFVLLYMMQDVRFALRMLVRNPWFSLVAIVALALGIGPNSAIFSIVSAVLLRPLPLEDSERVVSVWESNPQIGFSQIPASEANYLDWRRESRSFERTATAFALPEYGLNVMAGGEPERVPAGKAAAGFFDVMGARPVRGREFLEEEDREGGPGAVVVSHGFWQRKLGGDAGAIGRRITVDGLPRTVVGVLPANFEVFGHIDVWIPVAMNPNSTSRSNRQWGVFAKLKPGVTVEQAQAEMNGIGARLARQYPATNGGWGVNVVPIQKLVSGLVTTPLMMLLGAVGLLLLLACANVANLLLARAAGRQREIAVRVALGAGRWRVVRQLLTESVILSMAGGALGLLVARWSIGALRGFVPDVFTQMRQMSIDSRVLVFTFVVSLATGLVFGVAPALRISKADLNHALKSAGRTLTGSGVQRLRDGLVAVEIALALVLAVAAGLLTRSFARLMEVNPGMRTKDVLSMQLTLPGARYPEDAARARFFKNAVARVEALPGVDAAGAIQYLPFRSSFLNSRISVWRFKAPGEPDVPEGQEPLADYRVVTPGFFEAMGVEVREGRPFDARDDGGARRVVVVNEAMVRQHYGGGSAIGRRLQLPPWNEPAREIVGVVKDVKLYGLDWTVEPAVFVPYAQKPVEVMSLVVHSRRDAQDLTAAIRREVLALDAEQPVADVRTMESVMADASMLRRLSMGLIGAFALLALVLATVGIYGLTAYSVSQRTHEIGLRMALGASGGDVLRRIVGRGAVLALVGIGVGMLGALGVARIMKSFLFGISNMDPMIMVGTPAALLAIAVMASWVPARRAARVDPMVALREE